MSTYNKAKSGTDIFITRVDTDMHSFLCKVYENDDWRQLEIGGKETYCMKIQAYKPNSRIAQLTKSDTSVATLYEIKRDEFCSLRGKFDSGKSTDHLMLLGISIIRNMYRHVKTIKLDDASYKKCSNNTTIDFAFVNYLVYGKTWYERKYNARLSNDDQKLFDIRSHQFQEMKKSITWEAIHKIINDKLPEIITQQLYESAQSWQDFFNPIYNKMNNDEFCLLMSPLLSNLKDKMNYNFNKTYYIDINSSKLTHINYVATKHSRNGGSRRKKQRVCNKKTMRNKHIKIPNAVVMYTTDMSDFDF